MTTKIRYPVKAILTFGLVSLALTACGTRSRLSQDSKNLQTPVFSPAQQSVADSGIETKWAEHDISWKLPPGWRKLRVDHEVFNYEGPDKALLFVNIYASNLNIPTESELAKLFGEALRKQWKGVYQDVRRSVIDGVPGIEFTEAPMKDGQSSRIRQWRGYRDCLEAKQQIIVMLQTNSADFDKHSDEFTAIIYSMKAAK